MPIEYKVGDLFEAEEQALAHGCNCAGAMGKGIALIFKKRYPTMYKEYKKRCLEGKFQLGDVFVWEENGRTIFNLATQARPGPYASLEAIETSFQRMVQLAETKQITHIAMPQIGAGLGGLDWGAVKAVIEQVGSETEINLIVYELNR